MLAEVIDAHAHVWVEDSPQYPHHPISVPRRSPSPSASVERLLAEMDGNGVTYAVLVQASLYGYDNSYVADCVRRYPGRFAAVGMVDVRSETPVERLAYWVTERGLQGVRLAPLLKSQADVLRHPGAREIWEGAARLGVPVCLLLTPRDIADVEKLIRACPETRVVIDHLGRPDLCNQDPSTVLQPLLNLAQYPCVYVKVSALPVISEAPYPHTDTFALICRVYERFGSRRMVWATDFPHILSQCGYANALAILRRQMPFLTHDDKEWILGGTARVLWAFK